MSKPAGYQDCCASAVVLGVTSASFYLSYDGATFSDQSHAARVSDFRLDRFEITVGRFRKFVAAYTQNLIPSAAGKNPNNPKDSGWDPAWNANLPADANELAAALKCDSSFATWTDAAGTNESLPINCLTWYEAEAFCTWDGGRLPTEAEWNYAAAGGTEQRVYPWGAVVPGTDSVRAIYGCYYGGGNGLCSGTVNLSNVGVGASAGQGKWGQSDLAGNVMEWTQDFYGTYGATCDNCAQLTTGTKRVVRGGEFESLGTDLYASARGQVSPGSNGRDLGARCARNR